MRREAGLVRHPLQSRLEYSADLGNILRRVSGNLLRSPLAGVGSVIDICIIEGFVQLKIRQGSSQTFEALGHTEGSVPRDENLLPLAVG